MNESNSEKGDTPNDKFLLAIPEVFYDLICRMTPGILFLKLWCRDSTANTSNKISLEIVFLLWLAWATGLVLDGFGFFLMFVFRQFLSVYWGSEIFKESFQDRTRRLPMPERRLMIKILAERVFFRSLIILALLAIALPPNNQSRFWGLLGLGIALCGYAAKCIEYDRHEKVALGGGK
jgi:hypothetical protein